MSSSFDIATHSTLDPLPQSQTAWVKECEADFAQSRMQIPPVQAYDGQALSVPQFAAIYDYWSGFPRIDGAAVIEKIDPLGFRGALGDVMVIEPVAGGDDFRYRLFGSNTAARLGTDMTGRTVSELVAAPCVRRFIIRSYQAVVEERQAYLTMHVLPDTVATENWRRLILPVCNAAGEINKLLVGNIPGEFRHIYNDPLAEMPAI